MIYNNYNLDNYKDYKYQNGINYYYNNDYYSNNKNILDTYPNLHFYYWMSIILLTIFKYIYFYHYDILIEKIIYIIRKLNLFSNNSNNTNNNINNNLITKEKQIECFSYYYDYVKIEQFLQNEENLEKVIKFYKPSTKYLVKLKNIIKNNTELKFKIKTKENDYYIYQKNNYNNDSDSDNDNNNLNNVLEENIKFNINILYENERLIRDYNYFDIDNESKYYPLQFKSKYLCYWTNISRLNVIIWAIKIGLYDLFENKIN